MLASILRIIGTLIIMYAGVWLNSPRINWPLDMLIGITLIYAGQRAYERGYEYGKE